MFRIAGFVAGSGLAIVAMLLLFGVPQLATREPIAEPTPAQSVPEPYVATTSLPEPTVAATPLPETTMAAISLPEPTAIDVPVPAKQPETRWHSFWSPFGSQIAANGFISHLESVTGFDYRVVKIRTGVYEVAFAYTEETERLDKISTISTTAGLELPDT
jgi:hypothetical protein